MTLKSSDFLQAVPRMLILAMPCIAWSPMHRLVAYGLPVEAGKVFD
jgi:hypothetical protein